MKLEDYENLKFYLFLYKLFKQKTNGYFISFHCVREIMNRRLHKIPRVLHYEFLKEMEHHQLIRRVGSLNGKNIQFELIGKDLDKRLNHFNLPI